MKHISILSLFIITLLASCSISDESSLGDADGLFSSDASSDGGSTTGESSTNGGQGEEGLITAGEWNDLSNWNFWVELLDQEPFKNFPEEWQFFTVDQRISVLVEDQSNKAVNNVRVKLYQEGFLLWEAMTDNAGMAELWIDQGAFSAVEDLSTLKISLDDAFVEHGTLAFGDGINTFIYTEGLATTTQDAQVAFIVDATGSMGDELDFLKEDLKDVIERCESSNPNLDFYTASVFYRDESDEYLVKHQDFTADLETSKSYISQQSASGGGDFPEAVHEGLNVAMNELSWSEDAYAKIAFLLLDAPPHKNAIIIEDLHDSIEKAAKHGVKIIPISASGIDKETEFLMRCFAILTNGTYVFITDDSGIGNDHLEPSVGDFEVEFLNDLMVRLINKYTE